MAGVGALRNPGECRTGASLRSSPGHPLWVLKLFQACLRSWFPYCGSSCRVERAGSSGTWDCSRRRLKPRETPSAAILFGSSVVHLANVAWCPPMDSRPQHICATQVTTYATSTQILLAYALHTMLPLSRLVLRKWDARLGNRTSLTPGLSANLLYESTSRGSQNHSPPRSR